MMKNITQKFSAIIKLLWYVFKLVLLISKKHIVETSFPKTFFAAEITF